MNTIADIDDARLGRMFKALLAQVEKEGGSLSISRSNRRPFSPGVDEKDLQQYWTAQTNNFVPGLMTFNMQQATLSHADLDELLDRLAVATR